MAATLWLTEKICSRSGTEEDSELCQEIERFDQMKLTDEEQHLNGPDGVDLNSHVDIFYAILKQVRGW